MYEVEVQYFAAARDLAGCSHEHIALRTSEVSLAEFTQLLANRHPRLAPFLPRMRLALNDELHAVVATIRAHDRVAVLPPVAGGSDTLCELRDSPLSVDEAIAAVTHPGAGGIALFIGVVRDHAETGQVARLDYEAHERLAVQEMQRILRELVQEFPGVRLCALHRVGSLGIGEIAVIVAASAPHRAEAFAACRQAIDRIKASVPIWKKEWAQDGSALWVNLE